MSKRVFWTEDEREQYKVEVLRLAKPDEPIEKIASAAMVSMRRKRVLSGPLLGEVREWVEQAGAVLVARRKHNVTWDEVERDAYYGRAAEILAADHRIPVGELAKAAMESMPENRRRALSSVFIAEVSKWRKLHVKHQTARVGAEAREPGRVVNLVVKPSTANPFPHVPLPTAGRDDSPPVRDDGGALVQPTVAALATALAERAHTEAVQFGVDVLVDILSSPAVRAAIQGLAQVAVGKAEVAQTTSTEVWPQNLALPTVKVLVAGLKGHQITVVHDRFKDRFNLRFWETGKSSQQLRNDAERADYAIGFTKFLSHSAEAICKAKAAHFIRHHGGVSGLCDLLERLAVDTNARPPAAHASAVAATH
jgi:hypothetical protein